MAGEEGGTITTVEHGGFRIDSNSGASKGDIVASLTKGEDKAPETPKEKPDLSKAAADLGKAGGAAAAKKRAEAEKEKPAADDKKQAKAEGAGEEKPPAKDAKEKGEDKAEVEVDDKEKPLGKPRDDPRARMLEATRKEAEAKRLLREEREERAREREALERRLAALERGEKAPPPKKEPVDDRPQKPKPEDFEDYEEYLDARDEYNRFVWSLGVERHMAARAHDQRVGERVAKFNEHIQKAVDADAEFRAKIAPEIMELSTSFQLEKGQAPTAPNWLADEFILSPEQAPALMLHLTEHPEEFQRLVALPTRREVTREVTRLAARLEAATAGASPEPEKQVSKAAPPVRPVTGAPYIADAEEYRPGMSFDDYARVRTKQLRARR